MKEKLTCPPARQHLSSLEDVVDDDDDDDDGDYYLLNISSSIFSNHPFVTIGKEDNNNKSKVYHILKKRVDRAPTNRYPIMKTGVNHLKLLIDRVVTRDNISLKTRLHVNS